MSIDIPAVPPISVLDISVCIVSCTLTIMVLIWQSSAILTPINTLVNQSEICSRLVLGCMVCPVNVTERDLGIPNNNRKMVTTHPRLLRQNRIASHTADCGSQGARGPAQGDRAVPLRLGRANVATHFVGGGIRSHRFSLTDGDSSDSTLGCIKMSSPSYPKKS
jgi:hypothetical protein